MVRLQWYLDHSSPHQLKVGPPLAKLSRSAHVDIGADQAVSEALANLHLCYSQAKNNLFSHGEAHIRYLYLFSGCFFEYCELTQTE